jgi:hypothetical protein
LIRGVLAAVAIARAALALRSAKPAASACLTLAVLAGAALTLASAESAAATTLCLTLGHALLERRAFLGRHRGHPLFHPLATLFRRHVWIEAATASAAIEPAAAAPLHSALAAAIGRPTVRGHAITAALRFRRRPLTLTTLLPLALSLSRRLLSLRRYGCLLCGT